jgi:Ca2+-binding EF-hand superfamily protein
MLIMAAQRAIAVSQDAFTVVDTAKIGHVSAAQLYRIMKTLGEILPGAARSLYTFSTTIQP